MNFSSIPSNTGSAITPFNPLGRATVGEEEKESKNSTFKAIEEPSQSERSALREKQEETEEAVTGTKDKGEEESKQKREEKRQQREDQDVIRELAARDREVRNHERAHASVGGQYAGAPSYQFKRGPDGVNYAVGGEVSIETGAVNADPQATINKAQQVRRAALAPADPSPQDRRVAAQATQLEVEAREELNSQRQEQAEKEAESEAGKERQDDSVDGRQTAKADESTNITQDTNQRLIDINRGYFDLQNQSDRLGSIVSEAV